MARQRSKGILVAVVASLLAMAAWGAGVARGGEGKGATLKAVVSIPPLESLTRGLLPAGGELRVLIPPGRSEHGFEFTPGDLAAVGEADVVVLVGLGLEPRIEKALADRPNAKRQVVRFGEVLGLRQPEHVWHEDEHDDAHGALPEGWIDQHVWLDPSLVEKMVPAIAQAISRSLEGQGKLDDAARAALRRGEAEVLALVRQVDAEFREKLAPAKGKAIVTNHNAFSRLAQRYGLTIAATLRELESSEPTPSEVARVVKAVREHKASAIFVEPQYSAAVGRRLGEQAGVRVGRLDAMGKGDWAALMRSNLDELTRALRD